MGPAWDGHAYIDGNGTPRAGLYLNAMWLGSGEGLAHVDRVWRARQRVPGVRQLDRGQEDAR